MTKFPILSLITFLPFFGAIVLTGIDPGRKTTARFFALGFSLLTLGLGVFLWTQFNAASGDFQFEETHAWVSSLGIHYHTALDGLSLVLVMLTVIVVPMAILAAGKIQDKAPLYFSLILFLESGLLGTFTALNFFHWFLFWELSLIPAFFLIKLWGGPLRGSAAAQFFIYTMVGSVGLLLAFLAIFLSTGKADFTDLAELGRNETLSSALQVNLGWYHLTLRELSLVIFSGAFLGFAVKVPLIPFHSWLPGAYSEAPTSTTMLLTGVMSKMGVYGFLRILMPIFPEQMRWAIKPLLWLAVISIVLSAGAALAQKDLRKILAYSSINHLGYCMLGIFAAVRVNAPELGIEKNAALNGVFLQIFNHGLTAAMLFWFVGMIEERSGGLRGLECFGGLRRNAPILCGLMGICLFSSLGLPGLNGFVGEFLIFKGSFPLATWATALSVIGLLLTAIFILNLIQRVFHGPENPEWSGFPEMTFREIAIVLPGICLIFLLGVYPQLILRMINSTVAQMVEQLKY